MKLIAFISALLLTLTHALPQSPTITPTGPLYLLRTCVLPNQPPSAQACEGLYVDSYHTGAGLSDAFLVSNRSSGIRGFLNGTVQEFALGNAFPWSMVLGYQATYAAWEPVQINAGLYDGLFGIVEGRLVATLANGTEDPFKGWRGEQMLELHVEEVDVSES